MPLKNQGTELNRTVTNFFAPGDFGAFATTFTSVILRGDSSREIFITGFSFTMRLGAPADVNPDHFLQVGLLENETPPPESSLSPLPGKEGALRFMFARSAPEFQNRLAEQLDAPFRLNKSVPYAIVATITLGAAIAGTITTFLTVFGFERIEGQEVPFRRVFR